jgi:hypothetical protein
MKTNISFSKLTYLIIAFAYSIFLWLIYNNTGIVTINEAEKYILASQELAKGNIAYTFKHHLFYSSYILFVTPFLFIAGTSATIIAQAIMNILAAICIKKTIDILLPNTKLSLVGAVIFLFSYPLQYWTLTLFSDNFFVCIICISLYYTLKKKTKKEFAFLLFLLVVLVFTRPPGIFLSTALGCYYLYNSKLLSGPKAAFLATISSVLLLVLIFYLPVETKGYIKPIAAGCIIVDKPDYDVSEFNNLEKSTLSAAYTYLLKQHDLSYIIGLYSRKAISFFTLTRPYYSAINNSILTLHYLLYAFAFGGIFCMKKNKATLVLFLSCILLVTNLTALTYNEWHYRFTLAIFPFIIILSVVSFNFFLPFLLNSFGKK